jgi:hypothetical protein
MQADFLTRLSWVKVLLQFEAVGQVELPPFCGPSFRGALGHTFRPALCERRPPCQAECLAPNTCRFYALFEQSRAKGGTGVNIPKPMVLAAPVPAEFESIVLGGPVIFPYRVGKPLSGEALPTLSNDHYLVAEPGTEVTVGLTFLGEAAAAMVPVIDFLRRSELSCGRGHLRLRRVVDSDVSGRVLFDHRFPAIPVQPPRVQVFTQEALRVLSSTRRVRVVFRTPSLLKLGEAACFDPERLARAFPEHCMIRAVRIYNAFFAHQGRPLPWMTMPDLRVRLAGHRLFHYVLPRLSLRQDRWMRFDGVVGYMDLEGDLTPAMRFLHAAEVLHFGQKATFGLGEVRVYSL